MEENPYSGILNVMRRDAEQRRPKSGWLLGVVQSAAPLAIFCGGMQDPLTGADLRVNYQLRGNAERVTLQEAKGSLTGTVDCEKGSITGMEVSSGTLEAAGLFGGVLAPGDLVALLPSEDGQEFLVLCKVVNA